MIDLEKIALQPTNRAYWLPGIRYKIASFFVSERYADESLVGFRSLSKSDDIIEWAERYGFDDQLCDMLTMQVAKDLWFGGFRITWSITLPDEDALMLFKLGLDLNG